MDAVGFPVVIDWATSVIAMGRVQQLKREGKSLPPGAAVDQDGKETLNPNEVSALKPFGAHKGYGLSLINEIIAGFIGASKPTLRSNHLNDGDKHTPNFYFQVIHPDAISSENFAFGRTQQVHPGAPGRHLGGENPTVFYWQMEAEFAKRSERAGGLLFSEKEIEEFSKIAVECNQRPWSLDEFTKEVI